MDAPVSNSRNKRAAQANNGSASTFLSLALFVIITVVGGLIYFQFDVRGVVQLAGVSFFYFCIFALFIFYFGDYIKKIVGRFSPKSSATVPEEVQRTPEDVLAEQQKAARRRIQAEHEAKAEDYTERVLKPRQEAKKADLEKEFYRFAGPAWKGKGERARSADDSSETDDGSGDGAARLRRRHLEGTGRDAAEARKLPESVTNPPKRPEEPTKTKLIITLPDEPVQGSPQSITVAMRGTLGLVKRRRFAYTEKVQVLFDWMMKQGYHHKLYTLVTPYPRQDLSHHATQTLEDVGIDHDIALVIELIEKDDES